VRTIVISRTDFLTMIDKINHLPPEARRSRRTWLLWAMGGLAALVCVLAVLAFVYRRELVAVGHATIAIRAGKSFVDETAPVLRRDFPFDPAAPPAFDGDLFERYCRARQAIATQGRGVFDKMMDLGRSKPEMLGDRGAILREIGPMAREMTGLFGEIEKALRANHLSVELYRWTATQTWGHVALAARRGDPAASSVMALLRSEFGANIPELARASTPGQVGDVVLGRIGSGFKTSNDAAAWGVIHERWATWSVGAPVCAVDFAVMEFWDEFSREMQALRRK
jgi:hypothetical protein